MKFQNNKTFHKQFESINKISYYPYVGLNYEKNKQKILVFAHNIPIRSDKFELESKRMSSPTHFADSLEEYTYKKREYTKAFRNFIKGANKLSSNYSKNSDQGVKGKIDSFVSKISFANYINGLVKSDTQIDVKIDSEQLELSHKINTELINILKPTHIICWGKDVFDYVVKTVDGELNYSKSLNKKGFAQAQITKNKTTINILKTFHPSMPGFGHLKPETHNIIGDFLENKK